ncbi:MAG: lipoyl(octanoyl) transferase LipB [Sulfuriferula sp.]
MQEIIIRQLGRVDYSSTWHAMQDFTARRSADTCDEIWLLEHPSVYTLGLAGQRHHLLQTTDIPLVQIDRGGQITYHGPGQLVAYLLIDLKRRNYGVRELVQRMEQAIIDLLHDQQITAHRLPGRPGVYVEQAKIAALGLRIKRGCSYHGLAVNIDMDLTPFNYINPCGYENLLVTQMRDLGVNVTIEKINIALLTHLVQQLTA